MKKLVGGLLLASSMLVAGVAQAAVINFDELQGNGAISSSYAGLGWNSDWYYYDSAQDPYNPASGTQRVYSQNNMPTFSFAAPTTFAGAFFAGPNITTNSFSYYLGGAKVGDSASLTLSNVPTFLASGYSGLVDKVTVNSSVPGFWVMDDLKFGGGVSAVPEPATWAMMIGGFGVIGGALRRRRRAARRVAIA